MASTAASRHRAPYWRVVSFCAGLNAVCGQPKFESYLLELLSWCASGHRHGHEPLA